MDLSPASHALHRVKALLLLLNLLVAKTLGDCPKPLLAENTVLTNEALLMNEFPDDVEISLTCANGYVKDSGSGSMRCTSGAWGDLDLTCKKKDCGPPPPQPHMTFNLSQGTLFGATAKVICEKGYLVKGPAFKHCYNAGWTGKSTKCEIVTCALPEKLSNGLNSWDSDDPPKYGENVQFFCDEGFSLSGRDSVMCTEEGVYDFSTPQCLETSASSTASATATVSGHRGSTLTASATVPVSLSARGGDNFRNEDTPTSPTAPYYSQGDQNKDVIDTKKETGYTPVIISVVCVTLAVCVAVLFIHRLLLKRKGSYDTREDLKPELLPFQNL